MTLRAALSSTRLWLKLAAFAALGVVVTHAIHLGVGLRVATHSLERSQLALGTGIARLVAHEAAEPVLVHDIVTLSEITSGATSNEGVAYCFVVRNGVSLASSFAGGTPPGLVSLRSSGATGPIVVVNDSGRYLDVQEPILDGGAGFVRVGIDMATLQSTRREIAIPLGLLALGVIVCGLVAALVVGRNIARPLDDVVVAADRFDPAHPAPALQPRGGREIERLVERFNGMTRRLVTAHEERVQARDRAMAQERLAALGSLVAGVAHEVNNPLAGLTSCLDGLDDGDLSPEKQHEYRELMRESIDRLREVVRRLLEFARPRSLAIAPVAVPDLARDAAALLRPLLRGRGITLAELHAPGADAAHVAADRKQIGQALLNLLLNSAYVTPDGGELRIRSVARPGFWGIAIEDDGPGIPPALRARVLDPFFSTKPEGEGTGLGLSVTHAIVEAHGGALAFDFPETGGTVATLWLQVATTRSAVASA